MIYTIGWQPKYCSFDNLSNKSLSEANLEALRPWYLYLKLFTTTLEHHHQSTIMLIVDVLVIQVVTIH